MSLKLKKVIEIEKQRVNLESNLVVEIKNLLDEFVSHLNKEIKKQKLKSEVFVGGSFAKGTLIKRDKYEIDIFLRFEKKYEDISELGEKIIKKVGLKYIKLHGSRDYFQINIKKNLIFEVVPVRKISKPKEAENITDLSYFHVNYVKNALKKNKKLGDEIKIAKAFTHAQRCYGAESYIKGFSGYALELLIIHYKSFEKFLREITKSRDKIIIFGKKQFRNKNEVLLNINQAKLDSAIIFMDPTFKERNALAALSNETFEKFKNSASKFLKKPSEKFFQVKKIDFDKIRERTKKNKKEFVIVEIETDKQAGDIAGSKLLKFYSFLNCELEKYFKIKNKDFEYNDKQTGKFYIIGEKRKEILIKGPPLKLEKYSMEFKKRHKNIFVKKRILYSKEKQNLNLKDFLMKWRERNERKLDEMSVKNFKIKN